MNKEPYRVRDNVYIIGAGFSAGLGYPLTNKLLYSVWNRLNNDDRDKLNKIILFHYPYFDKDNLVTFPNIEQLLTLMKVNEDLFHASREVEGKFRLEHLQVVRGNLLYEISLWFHELYNKVGKNRWLDIFCHKIKKERAGIISFNWDLVLDYKLFDSGSLSDGYGLKGKLDKSNDGPILLKPHGSLNWYEQEHINKVKDSKRINIYKDKNDKNNIDAFVYPRKISSKKKNKYTPLIIPPMYLKDFNRPIFQRLWQRATALLSTAKNIYILGYSLPKDDLQAQFILRCGFHNQIEGRLKSSKGRYSPTGPANVYIVNPSKEIESRFNEIAGPDINIKFINKTVEDWVLGLKK